MGNLKEIQLRSLLTTTPEALQRIADVIDEHLYALVLR